MRQAYQGQPSSSQLGDKHGCHPWSSQPELEPGPDMHYCMVRDRSNYMDIETDIQEETLHQQLPCFSGFRSRLTCASCIPGIPALDNLSLGRVLSLHNYMSQFLLMDFFLYVNFNVQPWDLGLSPKVPRLGSPKF